MNDNDITGTLPTELGNLVNMTHMSFNDCLLEGTIPSEFGRMIKLTYFLRQTCFPGTHQTGVCLLRNLALTQLVVDCSTGEEGAKVGVEYESGENGCCKFCRRTESGLRTETGMIT